SGRRWPRLSGPSPDPGNTDHQATSRSNSSGSSVFQIQTRSSGRHRIGRHTFQCANTGPLKHPLKPCINIGTIRGGVDTEFTQEQESRSETDVRDRELSGEELLTPQLAVEIIKHPFDPLSNAL